MCSLSLSGHEPILSGHELPGPQAPKDVVVEDSMMMDPPRATPSGDVPVVEPDVEPAESPPAARPTRGTPAVVYPTLAETLALKTTLYGAIITTYHSPNYNSKKINGTVQKLIEHLAPDEVRLLGLRTRTRPLRTPSGREPLRPPITPKACPHRRRWCVSRWRATRPTRRASSR